MPVTEGDIAAAAPRRSTLRAAGHAVTARCGRRPGTRVVALHGRARLVGPVQRVQGSAGAPAGAVDAIGVSPSGPGLPGPAIDADVSVPGLPGGVFGTTEWTASLDPGGPAAARRFA